MKPDAPKGNKEVDLKPGDMLIYSGCELRALERTISR